MLCTNKIEYIFFIMYSITHILTLFVICCFMSSDSSRSNSEIDFSNNENDINRDKLLQFMINKFGTLEKKNTKKPEILIYVGEELIPTYIKYVYNKN